MLASTDAPPCSILLIAADRATERPMQDTLVKHQVAAQVQVVPTAEDALALLADPSHTPDLVVLDASTPEGRAIEVLRHIKTDPSLMALPVLVVSDSPSEDEVRQCHHLRVNGYILMTPEPQTAMDQLAAACQYWLADLVPAAA